MDDTYATSKVSTESEIITKQLLEKIVTQISDRPKGNVLLKSFAVTDGSEKGDNYASITSSVKAIAQIGDVEKTYHLFIKTPHKEGLVKEWMDNKANVFTKESLAYSEVIPAMVRLQRDKGLTHMGPSVPTHYYSVIEETGGLVVLEDLRPMKYTLVDKRRGLDEAHCELVMKELAIFHALAFGLKKENPQNMRKFDTALREAEFIFPLPDFYTTGVQSTLALVKNVTKDDKIIKAAEKLHNIDLNTVAMEQIKPKEPFATICHGDAWCNNMLFRYETQGDTKIPVDVELVDLQCFRYALPTTDLTYFFYTSTTRTTRKKHLKNLLALYHSHFTECLKRLDVDFPEFTLVVLEELFKEAALLGIQRACLGISAYLSTPENAPDFSLVQAENTGQYLADMARELLSIDENQSIIEERLLGAIEEAAEMGVL